jgi:hypothetical protein
VNAKRMLSSAGSVARKTSTALAVTSIPMPSPGKTAMLSVLDVSEDR